MLKYKLFAGAVLFLLGACGPIIGAGLVAGGGVKAFYVVEGEITDLALGSRVLVVGPFAKTENAYYICRGEEAASFTSALNSVGLFQANFYLGDRFGDLQKEVARLRRMTPGQLHVQLGLKDTPDLLLSGVILNRSTVAAPAKGVLMDVGYRLEFFDLRNQKIVRIEVQVKDLFQNCIEDVAEALSARMAGH